MKEEGTPISHKGKREPCRCCVYCSSGTAALAKAEPSAARKRAACRLLPLAAALRRAAAFRYVRCTRAAARAAVRGLAALRAYAATRHIMRASTRCAAAAAVAEPMQRWGGAFAPPFSAFLRVFVALFSVVNVFCVFFVVKFSGGFLRRIPCAAFVALHILRRFFCVAFSCAAILLPLFLCCIFMRRFPCAVPTAHLFCVGVLKSVCLFLKNTV